MRTLSLLLVAFVATTSFAFGQAKPAPKEVPVVPPREGKTETIQLFDGKTTAGWEGYEDLWSVKDGVIVAKNQATLVQHLLANEEEVQRLPADFREQAGRIGNALGRQFLGASQTRCQQGSEEGPHGLHLRGPPRYVPIWLRHVRSLRP